MIYSGEYVYSYVLSLNSRHGEDHFKLNDYSIMDRMLNTEYVLSTLNIQVLANECYHLSNTIGYMHINSFREVTDYGLIGDMPHLGDNVLIDGYNRVTQLVYNKEKTFKCFVPYGTNRK